MERCKIINQNYIFNKEDSKCKTGYRETDFSYEIGKFCKLNIQWGWLSTLLRTLAGYFPNFRSITYRLYTHNSMSINYRCSAQHTIGSISGFFIKIGFYNSLGNHRLTCKIGFVYLQRDGFQQLTVSRDFLSGFQNNNIADYHILTGNLLYTSVTNNLHQGFLVYRIQ